MYKEKSIAAVVPAYNEETQITRVVETMPDWIDTILIVNDCSTDKTSEVVKSLQSVHSKVLLIEHDSNQGVGGAIATGYQWVVDNNLDIAVIMAGDG